MAPSPDASALSLLPVAVSVAAPAAALRPAPGAHGGGCRGQRRGHGGILERASDGARASITLSAIGAAASVAVGTAVTVTPSAPAGAVGGGRPSPSSPTRSAGAALQRAHHADEGHLLRSPPGVPAAGAGRGGAAGEQRARSAPSVQRAMNWPSTPPPRWTPAARRWWLARAGQDLSKYGLRRVAPGPGLPRDGAAGAWCTSSTPAAPRAPALPPGSGRVLPRRSVRLRPASRCRSRNCRRAACWPLLRDNAGAAPPAHVRPTAWWPYPGRSATSRATSGRSRRWRWRSRRRPRVHARTRPGLAEVQRLRAHHAASERASPGWARATAANIAFDDHPSEKRFAGPHRDRHRRLGVRLVESQRTGHPGATGDR